MTPPDLTTGSWIIADGIALARVVHATDVYVHAATATDRYQCADWFSPAECRPATGADFTRFSCAARNLIEQRYRALIDTRCENCGRAIPVASVDWSPDMGYAAGIGFCDQCDPTTNDGASDDVKALRDAIRTALGLIAPLAPTGPLTAAATVLYRALGTDMSTVAPDEVHPLPHRVA